MIRIVEVGPRDGLQNEKAVIPTEKKIAFIDALSKCGLDEIEVSAFVSPSWIPQLADAESVFSGITRQPDVTYSALVPNEQGLKRALACGVDKIAVFTAASESFTRKNINASVTESIERFVPVVRRAKDTGLQVRGYVSTAFWCPYEGKMAPEKTGDICRRLDDIGVEEFSIGDTIGKATTGEVALLLDALLPILPASRLAMHFHDTYGNAVENVLVAWQRGIERFDASVGGLGGCPFAPGAPGNVATESVVGALKTHGADVRVDLECLRVARETLSDPRRLMP